MTMIERVARAIAPKAWRTLGFPPGYDTPANKNRRIASLRHAETAIAAMRKPSVEMIEASYKAGQMMSCNSPEEAKALFRDVLWPAAIDAILNEEPTP